MISLGKGNLNLEREEADVIFRLIKQCGCGFWELLYMTRRDSVIDRKS